MTQSIRSVARALLFKQALTANQVQAVYELPSCVATDQLDGTWDHLVFRVQRAINDYSSDGEKSNQVDACRAWLVKYTQTGD